ncbi:FAD-dependent oxidoreductase [Gemmatimonas sp.]|jgi:ferredoxin--NADP+ reductase|uniref:FAD-dependent oxidoreductase n=1 Tax=Gemmatimonas sp. TaxID=1962908 RepID=UPI0037C101D0
MSIAPSSLRVAIVGSGPAGFYAAESLQKAAPGIAIDLIDRLPTPFGLVRGGVAPDHPKIKSVTRVFERIATQPGFRYLGHVRVGEDVTVNELRARYHALLLCYGAETDRLLGIPGESLAGSHAATEFVAWYNGHPDYAGATFDLTQREVAVVGIGNVAMDVARILAKPPQLLAATDLADHALQALATSQVQTIHIIARRGPVQAACTTPELRELGELDGVDVVVDPRDLELDAASEAELAAMEDRNPAKNLDVLREWAARPLTGAPRRVVMHFNASPVALHGTTRVERLTIVRNRLEADGRGGVRAVATDETHDLSVGLVFRSVGYRGKALPGVPFDDRAGVVPNLNGHVVEGAGSQAVVPGLYVAGWIKRGPQGIIGTNKLCAADTVTQLLADVAAGQIPAVRDDLPSIDALLAERGVSVTSWTDWQTLDKAEQARGAAAGRPRVKLTNVAEMLEIVAAHR